MEIFDIACYIVARENAARQEQLVSVEKSKRLLYMNSVLIATQVAKSMQKNAKLATYEELFESDRKENDNMSLLKERRKRRLELENKRKEI